MHFYVLRKEMAYYYYAWFLLLASLASAPVFSFADGNEPPPQVPCYFVFGDSLVDDGNNNAIMSLARADYLPYGIDFAGGPSGRFSNGLTTVDVISQLLGFNDFIPPYAGARIDQLVTGVNFASAAAGIREETGQQLGARITFTGQLENYQLVVQQLVHIIGDLGSVANHLGKCIFTVGMGSNDYLNNYFLPAFYSTSSRFTPQQYADALVAEFSQQLQILYRFGARKVALVGVGQVGCIPNELARRSVDGLTCDERINGAIRLFNQNLLGLVDQLNTLPGAHFTYINNYDIFDDIMKTPEAYGLKVINRGCCGVGRNNGQVTCLPYQTPCPNRHEYLFWDAFHPTEAVNILVGQRMYSAVLPSDAYPVDIRTLASL